MNYINKQTKRVKSYSQIIIYTLSIVFATFSLTFFGMVATAESTVAQKCVNNVSVYHDMITLTKQDIERNLQQFQEGLFSNLDGIQNDMHEDNTASKKTMGLSK